MAIAAAALLCAGAFANLVPDTPEVRAEIEQALLILLRRG
jgi:hypothetical protein